MSNATDSQWKKILVTPEEVLDNIRPGMNIFLGSGSAEPRTLMKCLMRRYFYPLKTMPHDKMQEYVNVDYRRVMSIVALTGEPDQERIIAEGRFDRDEQSGYGDVAFVVDEQYQGRGIATYLYKMLIRLAKEQGLKGFTAEVLDTNKSMIKVFQKGDLAINARLQHGVYRLTLPFESKQSQPGDESISIQKNLRLK